MSEERLETMSEEKLPPPFYEAATLGELIEHLARGRVYSIEAREELTRRWDFLVAKVNTLECAAQGRARLNATLSKRLEALEDLSPASYGYAPERPDLDGGVEPGEEPSSDPFSCIHANEDDGTCHCPPTCYCKANTCKPPTIPPGKWVKITKLEPGDVFETMDRARGVKSWFGNTQVVSAHVNAPAADSILVRKLHVLSAAEFPVQHDEETVEVVADMLYREMWPKDDTPFDGIIPSIQTAARNGARRILEVLQSRSK